MLEPQSQNNLNAGTEALSKDGNHCFENKQDTLLFCEALKSANKYLESKQISEQKCHMLDIEEAVKIVVSTVNSLNCGLYTVNTVQELFEKQLSLNERLHSVLLINLLCSHKISSQMASSFYQSVLHEFPFLNWDFYLKLSSVCCWSENFIECAKQLPEHVVTIVLKHFLEKLSNDELKYYVWHLVLQTYIWKTFTMHCPSLIESHDQCSFQFDFTTSEHLVVPNEIQEYIMNNSGMGHLPIVYNIVLSNISQEINENININVVNVVLHAMKTIFKLVNTINSTDGPCMEKINELTPLFEKCISSEKGKALINVGLLTDNKCMIDAFHLTTSLDINKKYLIFVLINAWRDMVENIFNYQTSRNLPVTISDYRRDFCLYMKERNLSHKTLAAHIENLIQESEDFRKKYIMMLLNVVKNRFLYASRADEYLVANSDVWEEHNILGLQEESLSILNPYEIHSVLADAIVKIESPDKKVKFLEVYYKVLSKGHSDIYNNALKHILSKWGYCDHFILTGFRDQLCQFERLTMKLKEAEKCLLPLFVQNPKVVLHTLIKQAMMSTGKGNMEIIQILKTIPSACYQDCDTCPLLDEILPYFQKKLTNQEHKNVLLLIEAIMKVEAAEDILPFDLFLDKCIYPNIQVADKMEFVFDCLKVSLAVLVKEQGLEISAEKYILFVNNLGQVIHYCINNHLGREKEMALHALKEIAKYKKRPDIKNIIKMNEQSEVTTDFGEHSNYVILYILEIFLQTMDKKDPVLLKWIEELTKTDFEAFLIWSMYQVNKEESLFNERKNNFIKFSYIEILKQLTESPLLHFSKEEWVKLLVILRQLLREIREPPNHPWMIVTAPGDSIYLAVRCLMDCFIIMLEENVIDDFQLQSSLSYALTKIHDKIQPVFPDYLLEPMHLLNIFLDTCHLFSILSEECYYVFMPFFNEVIKLFSDCGKVEKSERYLVLKLLNIGINNLPDCREKIVLRENCSKSLTCIVKE